MVTEIAVGLLLAAVAFMAGRQSKKHDCSPAWVDGWSTGYLAALDDSDEVRVHRDGDRHDA